MGIVIKLRRDSSTNWSNINPVLHEGEAGYELNTGKLKIGDGNTLWNNLPYFAGGESLSTEQIQDIFGSSFLVAGSGINLDYNDENDTLTISSSGVAFTIPTGNIDLHNGGVQEAQLLQFDDNTKQSVITGPTPDENTNAQRLIIQGQKGQGTGEGGDVYFWAGDADTNGGDIKIYAGDADNASSGQGGYVNIDGGNGYNQGGNVTVSGGNSTTQGGNVTISAGYPNGEVHISSNGNSNYWYFNNDGSLDLPSGKVVSWGQNGDTLGPPVAGGGTDRVRLWDFEGGGTNFNYAIGAEANHVWFAMDVNNGEGGFKFYSRDNQIFKISDDSKLVFPNSTTLSQGTFDNSTGGGNGISLTCYVGYELNWQGGHLKSTIDNGATASNILCDSAMEFPGVGTDNMQIDNIGLTFPDGTTQTTAAYRSRYYGSFYDTTIQTNPVATGVNTVSYNTTVYSSGVSIESGNRIKFDYTGYYNIQFSLQFDKIDGGDDRVDVWISKTGVFEPWSNTALTLHGNNGKAVAAWNFIVNVNAGEYYQLHWHSDDTSMRILSETSLTNPIRPNVPAVILTVIEI